MFTQSAPTALGSVSPPTSSGVCSRTVVPNEPLVLSCDLPASTPAAEVQWSPARPESGRVGVTLQGSLVFSYYDTSIDGPFATFSCSVSNPVTGQTLPSSSHFICSSGMYSGTSLYNQDSLKIRTTSIIIKDAFSCPNAIFVWFIYYP